MNSSRLFCYPDKEFLRIHEPDREQSGWFHNDRDDEKLEIRRMIADSALKVYGVLGNHDMDSCSKETACAYYGMPSPYYSFDRNGFRFIALDTNNIRDGETYLPFDHCNYGNYKQKGQLNWLGPQQLEWMKKQIMSSLYPCILLSHAPLADNILNTQDGAEVWRIIHECNRERRRVIFALNGHNHIDGVCCRAGVPFMSVNSASNIWIGNKYPCVRYSKTISDMYPYLKYTAPYWDALFAVITIDEAGIHVSGRQSSFVGPSPYELGFPKESFFHLIRPSVRDRDLSLQSIDADGIIDYGDIE